MIKKYDKYKESGVEWIGEIPEHWGVKKLKYVAEINPSRPSFQFDGSSDDKVVFLPMEKVSEGGKYNQELRKSINEVSSGFTCFEKGDVIVAKITPCFENGKGALLDELETDFGYGSTEFHTLRADEDISPKFLFYITRTHQFMKNGEAFMTGSAGQKRVPSSFVEDFMVGVPSSNEQTSIASYLDEKTTQIDTLIANKQKLIELLKEERTAIINQAVTKGLHQNLQDERINRIKTKSCKSSNSVNPDSDNVRMKPSGIEWLGEIPEHWEVKKLKYVADVVLGKMLTNDDKGGYFLKPYLRAANLQWLNADVSDVKEMWFSEIELQKLRLRKYDLLVSEGGEVGRTCIWNEEFDECYIQNSVHKITVFQPNDPKFFLYLFYSFGQRGFFDSIVNRISIAHLTGEKIKEIFIMVPPEYEQQSIVQHIETHATRIDITISKIEKEIELLQEYRMALISEVVTGKIKVI